MELGGWYPDPDGTPGVVRWWDGKGWTEQTARAGSAQSRRPPQPESPRRWWQFRRSTPTASPSAAPVYHDWRDRPTVSNPPAAPYDDPSSGIFNAPYDAPAAERAAPTRAVPYEDPAAGIYAARMDESPRSRGSESHWDSRSTWGSNGSADSGADDSGADRIGYAGSADGRWSAYGDSRGRPDSAADLPGYGDSENDGWAGEDLPRFGESDAVSFGSGGRRSGSSDGRLFGSSGRLGTSRIPEFLRGPALGYSFIALLIVGVVIAGLVLTGSKKPGEQAPNALASPPGSTQDKRPPLEQLCANTEPSKPDKHAPKTAPLVGPRIADTQAHISYAEQGPPFRLWDRGTWGQIGGGLGETFSTGQYFVTQANTPDNSPYMATILSGTVPATYGDDPHPNIECAARVIADDVRASYYPQPNTRKPLTAKKMTISGDPAYFLEFHLAFDQPGYNAKGELVAICVIDVPDSNKAAALYVSIPDTHRQYDKIVQPLISSIRVG